MKTVLIILVLAFVLALGVWVSPATYYAAYARAQARDVAYFDAHPDCSYEEAHRHRDRVNRLFFR